MFDFFLAAKLKMPVAELRRRLSMAEWVSWNIYYRREDQHRQMAQLGG